MSARRTPYTAAGIRRLKCSKRGCRRRAYASWQVCADGRIFRPLCWVHNVELNRLVLEWMGDPQRVQKIAKYSAAVIRAVNANSRRSR